MALNLSKICDPQKGLLIDEVVGEVLAERKYVRYSKEELPIYKEKFQTLVDMEIFDSESQFESHKWIAYGIQHLVTFDFTEIEYNSKLYLALKCFVITLLHDRGISTASVKTSANVILKMIKMTGGYDKRFLEEMFYWKVEKELMSPTSTKHYKLPNLQFLLFNPVADADEYIEFFHSIVGETNAVQIREIPTYYNFIHFDEIIHDFMDTTDVELKKKFYPVFIWWRFTAIIPLRPVEFVEIRNDSIRYDAQDEQYYIKVPRRKQRPNPNVKEKRIPVLDELKMTKEMYDIIQDYRQLANVEHEEYLFPLSHYQSYLENPKHSDFMTHYKDRFGQTQMESLLDRFFDDVIMSQYGVDVVSSREELDQENPYRTMKRFNLGDTRHLAICNMMMQGYSEITIAQMAGHTKIQTQSHYSQHMEDFERSYSHLLSKKILSEINRQNNEKDILDNDSIRPMQTIDQEQLTHRQKLLMGYQNEKETKQRDVEFGGCYSMNFPFECVVKECMFCMKFKVETSKLTKNKQKILEQKLAKVQDEIQVHLNFIKRYYGESFKKDETNVDEQKRAEKELEKSATNLSITLNQKAILNAYISKTKEV